MAEQGDSQTVKAGARTYFFDLKETKEGKPFGQQVSVRIYEWHLEVYYRQILVVYA